MSDRILVENSFVESLVKNAAWGAARVPLTLNETEEVVEEASITCPLCESTIAEEITDKQLKTHLDQIREALDSIDEAKKAKLKEKAKKVKEMGDEEEDEDELEEQFPPEEEEEEDEDEEDEDEEEEEMDMDEKSKKKESKVMKKVKELKATAKGKKN